MNRTIFLNGLPLAAFGESPRGARGTDRSRLSSRTEPPGIMKKWRWLSLKRRESGCSFPREDREAGLFGLLRPSSFVDLSQRLEVAVLSTCIAWYATILCRGGEGRGEKDILLVELFADPTSSRCYSIPNSHVKNQLTTPIQS